MWRRTLVTVCRAGCRAFSEIPEEVAPSAANKTRLVFSGERGINKVTLLGRVGNNAEMRGTEKTASMFSLATSMTFKRPDGTYEQMTDWHRIVVFRPGLKEVVANSVKKGDKVFVAGSIKYSQFIPATTDDEVVHPVKTTNIVADDVMILHRSEANSAASEVVKDAIAESG